MTHDPFRSLCRILLVCGVLTIVALPVMADDPPEPGFDVEGGPTAEGRELRDMTPLTDAERNAVDPLFRDWVRQIDEGRADKRVMRLYWYYRSRLEPFDVEIPKNWRQEALAQRSHRGDGSGIPDAGVWLPIGPTTIPGRITGLAQPANSPSTIFASAADGGVWKTTDAGKSWESLTDFEATLSGGSILLDPNHPQTIYFGTGEGNNAIDNYPGIGVLKSTDGGLTWTASANFSNAVRRLAMHPAQPNRVLAAGSGGCWVSNDGGANFIEFGGGLPNVSASDIVIRPDDPDTVYCAIWGTAAGGVWRTTNGGLNWSRLQNGIPFGTNPGRISLAISASNPDILIAGIQEGNGTVYYTADGGNSWVQRNLFGYCSSQCWYDNHVAIDSADPSILYAAGINIWRSLDSGLNWSQASSSSGGRCCNPNYVHVDHHYILTPSAGVVIAASDGGIFHSDDSGSSWDEWSQGMATTQYYGICRREGDAGWAFGGTQDNGSHRYQEGDPTPWASVLGGDGGMCMTGPADSNIIVGEHQNHTMRRSVNNGSSWSSATSGIGGGEPRPWVGILVADEIDRNNMWTATDRVYRSLDARATPWVDVSGPLEGNGVPITAIDVSPQNSNLVVAGYSGGSIYLTTKAILLPFSFAKIDGTELPNRSVRRLRFSPSSETFLYVVFGGFGSDRLWKLSNLGGSWTNITGNLPNIPVNDLRPDPNHPDSILAATDLGVYRSDDGGNNWYSFSTGLPTVAAIELTYDAAGNRLRLGTHGRSMWEWQPAIDSAVAVPDGATVAGTAMQASRLADGSMRVEWDVTGCTARNYNLFWGDLELVSTRTYSDATCGIGTSGRTDMPIPATPSGNLFFLVVGTDEAGVEGPHGFDIFGDAISANGIGLCGITAQTVVNACP